VWLIDVDIMNGFRTGRGELCHRLTPLWNGGVDGGDSGAAPCATTTTWDRGYIHITIAGNHKSA